MRTTPISSLRRHCRGFDPIRQVFANASTDPAFEVQFSSDRIGVAASGDLAYARGKFTEKYTDKKTGKVMTGSGSYITVYKKQDDGSWVAVEDFAAEDVVVGQGGAARGAADAREDGVVQERGEDHQGSRPRAIHAAPAPTECSACHLGPSRIIGAPQRLQKLFTCRSLKSSCERREGRWPRRRHMMLTTTAPE